MRLNLKLAVDYKVGDLVIVRRFNQKQIGRIVCVHLYSYTIQLEGYSGVSICSAMDVLGPCAFTNPKNVWKGLITNEKD